MPRGAPAVSAPTYLSRAAACVLLAAGCTTGVIGPGRGDTPPNNNDPPFVRYATARLTNLQYLNTVHDLFPGMAMPALTLPNENVVDSFKNAASGQTATALLIEDYRLAAEAIAQALGTNVGGLLSCAPTTPAEEETCAAAFISDFGKRAYRRPVGAAEAARFLALFKADRADEAFPAAITTLVQVFLQSPPFLYRLELGNGNMNGPLTALSSYELAARLSYLLTDSMPDAPLMDAAARDALQAPAELEAQARRLLADPRARTTVANFNYQWLGFVHMEDMPKSSAAFPSFTSTLGQNLHDATVKFADYAVWQQDSLTALLTDSHAYVNDALAPLYGVAAPGSNELQLLPVDATQRAGILTQAGFLAGLAGPIDDSPVKRGLSVLTSFLCKAPPPPPPGVNTTPPDFNPATPATTRERQTKQHAVGSCQACHVTMDAIGFAFENFDALGSWRTAERGLPVDASSALKGTDVDATFVGAVPLAQHLAESKQVAGCVSYFWLRYALGLDKTQINLAAAQPLADTFSASGGAFKELLVALVKSDAFRSVQVAGP